MPRTYLTTKELSQRIKYQPRTIRECLKGSVLLEGVHYIRPFGGRKTLYIWEQIERDMRVEPHWSIGGALMASVSLRSGHPVVDFRYRGIRCRERTGMSDTPQNRRKLQRLVARMEAEILLRTFEYAHYFPASPRVRQFCDIDLAIARSAHEVPTFREFTQTWFTESAVAWRHSHIECVRGVVDQHLLPRFGDIRLDEISRADVLAFRAELANKERAGRQKGLLAATINRILRPLRSILNEAASRYGFSSPVRDIKPLAVPRTRVEPFTLEEVRRFLNAVRKDFHPTTPCVSSLGCARGKSTGSNGSTSISSAGGSSWAKRSSWGARPTPRTTIRNARSP